MAKLFICWFYGQDTKSCSFCFSAMHNRHFLFVKFQWRLSPVCSVFAHVDSSTSVNQSLNRFSELQTEKRQSWRLWRRLCSASPLNTRCCVGQQVVCWYGGVCWGLMITDRLVVQMEVTSNNPCLILQSSKAYLSLSFALCLDSASDFTDKHDRSVFILIQKAETMKMFLF